MRNRRLNKKLLAKKITKKVKVKIPAWSELTTLSDGELSKLASSLSVPFTKRMETLSAINKLR